MKYIHERCLVYTILVFMFFSHHEIKCSVKCIIKTCVTIVLPSLQNLAPFLFGPISTVVLPCSVPHPLELLLCGSLLPDNKSTVHVNGLCKFRLQCYSLSEWLNTEYCTVYGYHMKTYSEICILIMVGDFK